MQPQFEKGVTELVSHIRSNTRRYVQLFSEVIDKLMPRPTKDISYHDDVIDVIIHQRIEKSAENEQEDQPQFPPQLMRR